MFYGHTASWGNGGYIVKLWLQLWLGSFICQVPRNTLEKAKKKKKKRKEEDQDNMLVS